ncbi:hypothetical protein PSTG_00561 [Puccinia striiformis f. sp. tritici PST-78]|uniref:Uncharacterized protein n=1 Tax=Puccinia striiformis f. sp. tritici PST-78 TaxID=1165861 RepID=A0A0L0W3G5_9BASI|nr:hypothetical protein PSTG_00561 [Puccinia striiformis f. sp. tritici PST-78]
MQDEINQKKSNLFDNFIRMKFINGGSSVTQKRQLDAEVDSIQPKKLKKCQELEILNRFKEFYVMQLLILKKMGVYVDEEDIEEFKDLIKDINESPILLEEDIKKM